ncbi:endoplasmic reticulum-Golgi intermediate compartment protein 2 [Strongylocentrotus purpuratus]|uniref:Endoplasmic reticulum-Golgi intermediate compartment protein 2 n=1 Tax=Strongylocentrotus purpuratus TaxID=7668 RepID=A0A7M7HGK4_STRPU|nr:endoplasmic reticulum-Golgi intermediate compartment protein 2 [Strongylocentrotus purpuratus]XP_011667009.1 endoplasmic reticulum-Golgi intermediate compartment protein 2 [Strongylocentrotus purpuratus]|eukprot:XP_011667008.1 PREDICTED: endoplasmic reticulum-Golgi intermediate compartment protein 2 [Strongylocentrotus purpuratus]
MRRLNRKETLKVVKELDAFPKIPEDYVKTTSTGGTVSIVTFIVIAGLVISEFMYYLDSRMKYGYDVDTDFNTKLQINIDITVAMKCDYIGADVLDSAGDSAMFKFSGKLKEEPTSFEMTPQQRSWHKTLQTVRKALSEEHAIQDLLFQTGFSSKPTNQPQRVDSGKKLDACRLHGSLTTNKVAGNFHVTIGKSIPHPRGHAHLALMIDPNNYNFSHRIDHFSYGTPVPGIVNPLDGDLKVTNESLQIYQYFIQIVPTKVKTRAAKAHTHQYAVTERERVINHGAGSHGVTGIFFKYELSSLVISVEEVYDPFWKLLVRLCGIVGGVFATSGIINSLMGLIMDVVCCRFNKFKSLKTEEESLPGHHLETDQPPSSPGILASSSSSSTPN